MYFINVYAPNSCGESDLGAVSTSADESDRRAQTNERMGGGRRLYRLRVHLRNEGLL